MYKQIEIDNEFWNYLIYDNGEVYSLFRNKFLKPDCSTGYARYLLRNNGKEKRMTGHKLVAEAFIPNPDNLPIIHHKDNNPFNNDVSNLEWISYSDNVKEENKCLHEKTRAVFSEVEIKNEKWVYFRDGQYSVSNLGRLYNNSTNKIKQGCSPYATKYIRDTLVFKDGTTQTIPRHRIVYEGFHPEETLKVINHIDGDKTNNRLNNLENITQSENTSKAYTETCRKKTRKVVSVDEITGEKCYFFSIAEAARFYNFNESNIRSALRINGKSHGYYWKEVSEEEYSQILKSSETIEGSAKKKNFSV